MIAQEIPTAQISPVAEPATPDPEAELAALTEETLIWDEDLVSLTTTIDQFFRAKDKAFRDPEYFEQALELKKELIAGIKLLAMGAGITKEILDSYHQLRAA